MAKQAGVRLGQRGDRISQLLQRVVRRTGAVQECRDGARDLRADLRVDWVVPAAVVPSSMVAPAAVEAASTRLFSSLSAATRETSAVVVSEDRSAEFPLISVRMDLHSVATRVAKVETLDAGSSWLSPFRLALVFKSTVRSGKSGTSPGAPRSESEPGRIDPVKPCHGDFVGALAFWSHVQAA